MPPLPHRLTRYLFWWLLFQAGRLPLFAQPVDLPQPELITDRQGLPQGFVPGIVQDRKGFIWMATQDGLCRYDGNRFKVFRATATGQSAVPFSSVAFLHLDHAGFIWITTGQNELFRFDPLTEQFTSISSQFPNASIFQADGIRRFYPDRQNRLWLVHNKKGLACFDLTTRRYRWFRHQASDPNSLSTDRIRSILQDRQGNIWIGTEDAGLERFEEKTGHFLHYRPGSQTPLALPELEIFDLYERPSGDLLLATHHYVCQFNSETGQLRSHRLPVGENPAWPEHYLWGMHFATDSRGTVYLDQRDRLFSFTDQKGLQLLTRFTQKTGFSSSLLVDGSDVLWIGTDGSGVRKYDLRTDGFQIDRYKVGFQTDLFIRWLNLLPPLAEPIMVDNPYMFRYTLDRQGKIWANVGSSVFYHINPATHQGERVDFPVPFASVIAPLATDEQGRVWALFLYTLWYYEPVKRQWIRSTYKIDRNRTNEIVQMVADQDAFWLATNNQGLFRLDRRTGKLRQYVHQPKLPTSLSSNSLYCLSEDPADTNRLWIGTAGNGLCAFDKRSGQCLRITDQEGLPNNVVYSALPDKQGNLWIGTNKGLCRMNRKTFQTRIYTTEDGLLANEFNRFHYLHLPDGQIIMGGVEGITSFQPAQLQDDSFKPKVELTDLYINNRLAQPDSSSFMQVPIQAVDHLSLPYYKNFITVNFAALQYNRPGKNRYRYRLEGVDYNWVKTDQPQAIYTTLAPGYYTLLVNASNTSGSWSPHVRRLGITIHPPFWTTWWAYGVYILAVAGSIWYGVRLRLNRLQLQQAVALRQQEARQLRELDAVKSRFFTNVTHDFRTPLTLILSPLAGLIQEFTGSRHQKRLTSIQRNAQQLLALINQLLDYAKLDAGALMVHETHGDLGQFVAHTLDLFGEEIAHKSVGFAYHNRVSSDYWFDADKLERILFNLVGNALKFTPPGGAITVTLQSADGILLTVADTGVGIDAKKIPFVFDRFFQADPAEHTEKPLSATPLTGTGIGLALVKELVELQRGQISLESQPGQGTTFRVSLPYRKADEVSSFVNATSPPNTMTDPEPEASGEQPHLLLVEDNPELADFIADSLPEHYRISRAANGAQGLELALEQLPDLVISDVMMPVMDGYTLCQHLKQNEHTNHIPVILLTAKVALENRLEGLGRGADDYLTKPFHVQELNLRIHNLLERQRRFQERMRQQLILPGVDMPRVDMPGVDSPALNKSGMEGSGTKEHDSAKPVLSNPFLDKLYTIVEEKLDDTAFSVEQLAEQLNMSRVHLHRKVKALTNLSTSEVIRNYRLKRATYLLREGLNSSETAYRVGFDSPAYFSKCFRELYGKTPLEYAQRN